MHRLFDMTLIRPSVIGRGQTGCIDHSEPQLELSFFQVCMRHRYLVDGIEAGYSTRRVLDSEPYAREAQWGKFKITVAP